MQIVDAHHHIWRQRDLAWLQGEMQPRIFGAYESIMRDYPIEEFRDEAVAKGVTRSIYVQANWPTDQFVDEVRWVSEVSAASAWPHAIVGYADFTGQDNGKQLRALAQYPLMRGVRQQFHWHENSLYRFASRPDLPADPQVIKNVRLLADYDWAFDLQVFTSQMASAATLAQQCPDVRFVLQHAGMLEDLSTGGRDAWAIGMKRLADLPNVYCKLSGLGTFIRKNDATHISDIAKQSIAWFGAERCLFGSNFPIEKIWTSYSDLIDAYVTALTDFSDEERSAIFARTAETAYRLAAT